MFMSKESSAKVTLFPESQARVACKQDKTAVFTFKRETSTFKRLKTGQKVYSTLTKKAVLHLPTKDHFGILLIELEFYFCNPAVFVFSLTELDSAESVVEHQ